MGQTTLSAIWIGSWKSDRTDASILHSRILEEAKIRGLSDLVSDLVNCNNGLIQFMILPSGSKDGFPKADLWEALAVYAALSCAGTDFIIKRVYVASN